MKLKAKMDIFERLQSGETVPFSDPEYPYIFEMASRTMKLSAEEKEDIGLAIAIEKGRKSGYVSEDAIMKTLHKIQGKK